MEDILKKIQNSLESGGEVYWQNFKYPIKNSTDGLLITSTESDDIEHLTKKLGYLRPDDIVFAHKVPSP